METIHLRTEFQRFVRGTPRVTLERMIDVPKLPDSTRELLERGEEPSGGKGPVDDGYYLLRFTECKEDPEKDSGYAGVNFTFEVIEPTQWAGSKVWEYVSYGPNAAWKVRQIMESAGYSFNSDFQELVDDEVELVADVGTEIQTKGKRKGKTRNFINEYFPVNDDTMALVGA